MLATFGWGGFVAGNPCKPSILQFYVVFWNEPACLFASRDHRTIPRVGDANEEKNQTGYV